MQTLNPTRSSSVAELWGRTLSVAGRLGAVAGLALLPACAPSSEAGCDNDASCPARGQVCDLETSTCVQDDIALDSTEADPAESFTNLAVPFFRGEVCVPHEVQSGATIPVSLSPCLHPCLTATSFEFKHFFSCVGSSCDAYATMWVVADSGPNGCPAEAFGRFDQSMCQFPEVPVDLGIGTTIDSGPISGTMLLEIPFLSNDDIEQVAAANSDQALFESLVFQYPTDTNRVPAGRAIQLLPGNPEPVAPCNGSENCTCYDIGY